MMFCDDNDVISYFYANQYNILHFVTIHIGTVDGSLWHLFCATSHETIGNIQL
jgi:hypothetical protein